MARHPHPSAAQRQEIVDLVKLGKKSYGEVCAQMAKKDVWIERCTVGRIVKRYEERNTTERRVGSGRQRKTTARLDRRLVALGRRNRRMSREELRQAVDAPVVLSTISRRLNEAGLYYRAAPFKPLISPVNKQKRVKWASEHLHWQYSDWKRVIFTDESDIRLLGVSSCLPLCFSHPLGLFVAGSGRSKQHVWRESKPRRSTPLHIAGTLPFGGGKPIRIWGAIGADINDAKWMKIYDGTLNGPRYKAILEAFFPGLPARRTTRGRNLIFSQDGAPPHQPQMVKSSERLPLLQLPPQSPDLNPIEHIWSHLKRKLGSKRRNRSELIADVRKIWQEIDKKHIENLVRSMPDRCNAVLKASGGPTSY